MMGFEKIISELASENILTTEQARVFSQKIRLSWGSESLPSWTVEEAQYLLDSAFLLIESGIESLKVESRSDARLAFKRSGEILEWLSKTDPNLISEPELILLSALCYQLSCLPAMARGVLNSSDSLQKEANIFKCFIGGEFNRALIACLRYHNRNSLDVNINGFIISEIIRAVGLFSAYFREGAKGKASKSISRVRQIEEFVKFDYPTLSWNVVRLTRMTMEVMFRDSIWNNTNSIIDSLSEIGKEKITHYIKRLNKSNQSIVWPTQKKGIEKLSNNESFALCTPTGSGKTLVAELSIFKEIFSRSIQFNEMVIYPLILYIVPSRALASEVEYKLSQTFRYIDSQVLVTGIYGGSEWNVGEAWLTAERPTVAICTVEKADAVLRYLGSYLLLRLAHIVLDEAHQVLYQSDDEIDSDLMESENRSLKLESFMSRVLTSKPKVSVVALSAVAGGSENNIAKWVARSREETAVSSNTMSTRQLFGSLICKANGRVRIVMDVLNSKKLSLNKRKGEAYIPEPFREIPPLTGRHKDPNNYGACCALWGAVHLALKGKRSLISITQRINGFLKLYRDLFENTHAWRTTCPAFFEEPEEGSLDDIALRECLDICKDYCGVDSLEYYFLSNGIAIHHAQLPTRLRAKIVELIKRGVYQITIATSTLTEGVNLPFDNIFLPLLHRWDGKKPKNLEIGEIKNLMGRAGRAGSAGEGIILACIAEESFAGIGTKKRGEQEKTIRLNKRRYDEVLASIVTYGEEESTCLNNSPLKILLDTLKSEYLTRFVDANEESFYRWLEEVEGTIQYPEEDDLLVSAVDSVDLLVLAVIEEIRSVGFDELSLSDIEKYLKDFWSKTFGYYLTQSQDTYERILEIRGKAILKGRFGSEERQTQLYRMGFAPRKAEYVLRKADSVLQLLNTSDHYFEWSVKQRLDFFQNLISELMAFRFFDLKVEDNDWTKILKWWVDVPDAEKPGEDSISDWLRFSSQFFDLKVNIALGSILASKWNYGDKIIVIPDLNAWREKTGFPWTVFWIRELLNWGTHEPVVAFLLAMKASQTRSEAMLRSKDYFIWAKEKSIGNDEIYHPSNLNKWFRDVFANPSKNRRKFEGFTDVELTREFKDYRNEEYQVFPVEIHEELIGWYDPAGYLLAKSSVPQRWNRRMFLNLDFKLLAKDQKLIFTRS